VMENGRLHQWDTPFNLYHQPRDRFTARFIGEGVLMKATVIAQQELRTVFGTHSFQNRRSLAIGEPIEILLRPDDLIHDDDSKLQGKVIKKAFRGSHFLYQIRLRNGEMAYCLADSHHDHNVGEWIGIRANIDHIVTFCEADDAEQIAYSTDKIQTLKATR